MAQKLNAAYAMDNYDAAKFALTKLHRELMDFNPSAACSLAEGMEETLTVHKLQVPPQLRQTLASTNVIESAFSMVERVCLIDVGTEGSLKRCTRWQVKASAYR